MAQKLGCVIDQTSGQLYPEHHGTISELALFVEGSFVSNPHRTNSASCHVLVGYSVMANSAAKSQLPYQSAFQKALDEFKKGLKPKHEKNFTMTTLDELKQAIVDIQAKQRSERRQRCMKRLGGFLEAMEQYGNVIAIFCNSNEFVAFVWVKYP
jgi:hypothetical protein